MQLNYGMDLGFSLLGNGASDLNLSLLATWTESNLLAPDQTDPTDVIECAGFFGLECGEPQAVLQVDGPC